MATVGAVEIARGEAVPLTVTPKHTFAKGDRLGVVIEKIVLTPE